MTEIWGNEGVVRAASEGFVAIKINRDDEQSLQMTEIWGNEGVVRAASEGFVAIKINRDDEQSLQMTEIWGNKGVVRATSEGFVAIKINRDDEQSLQMTEIWGNEGVVRAASEGFVAIKINNILHLFYSLNNYHLTDNYCYQLASGIRNNQRLRTLSLSDNNLEGPNFIDLMEALPTSRIEEFHLDRNQLTDSSCPHLASGIRNNQTLRILNLSGNNLKGPHFSDLMAALPTSRIEELQLDKNPLTDSSCPHLASGIRNNLTLKTLNLSWNNLEGPHFRNLMAALTTSQIGELQIIDKSISEETRRELKQLKELRSEMRVVCN